MAPKGVRSAELTAGCCERLIGIFVRYKRRKGQPYGLCAVTSRSPMTALVIGAEFAKRLKVPTSWIELKYYRLEKPAAKAKKRGK